MSGGISFFSHLHALNTKWQLDLGSYLAREAKARMAGGSGITELLTGSSCSLPGSLFHEDKRSLASSRVHSYYAHTLITAMLLAFGSVQQSFYFFISLPTFLSVLLRVSVSNL